MGNKYALVQTLEVVLRTKFPPDSVNVGVRVRDTVIFHEFGDAYYAEVLVHS
jgi:hypothetical protein